MKRKTLTLVLCLLTVMSLVGVGFASWVINADVSETASGEIIVDTVADQRFELTITTTEVEELVFTAPVGRSETGKWLTSNNDQTAKLEVKYSCKVNKKDSSAFALDVKTIKDLYVNVNFEAVAKAGKDLTAYNLAVSKNVFAEMGTAQEGYRIENVILNNDNNIVTFDLIVGYVWGSKFEGSNPFDYYGAVIKEGENAGELVRKANSACGEDIEGLTNPTWADHANYYLTLLSQIKDTVMYNVTVTISKTTSEGAQQLATA